MTEVTHHYNLNIEFEEPARQATIHFHLEQKSQVLLCVMNHEDKEVRLLVNESLPQGRHTVLFAFGNLQPDLYLVRLLINNDDAVDIETLNINIH